MPEKIRVFLIYFCILIMVAYAVFPLAWMTVSSIKPNNEIFERKPEWIPRNPTFDHYLGVITGRGATEQLLTTHFKNTIVISVLTVFLTLALAIFGGYGLAKFRFRGRTAIFISIIISQMFPCTLLMLPYFVLFKSLNLIDTYSALVLVYSVMSLPFCVLLSKSFLQQIPSDLEDCAMIDGCSREGAFLRIILPLCAPGIIACAVYTFVTAWSDFIWAFILTSTERSQTLQIGLNMVLGMYGEQNWGLLLAASVLATIPAFIVFMFLQRYVVIGLTSGAVKG